MAGASASGSDRQREAADRRRRREPQVAPAAAKAAGAAKAAVKGARVVANRPAMHEVLDRALDHGGEVMTGAALSAFGDAVGWLERRAGQPVTRRVLGAAAMAANLARGTGGTGGPGNQVPDPEPPTEAPTATKATVVDAEWHDVP
jgi:hypothetical protein